MECLRCRKTASVAAAILVKEWNGGRVGDPHPEAHHWMEQFSLVSVQASYVSALSTFPGPSNGSTGTSEVLFCTLPELQKILASVVQAFFVFPETNDPISPLLSGLLPSEISMQEASSIFYH